MKRQAVNALLDLSAALSARSYGFGFGFSPSALWQEAQVARNCR